jgi:transcriptional regulator with XRE-family HTH domain
MARIKKHYGADKLNTALKNLGKQVQDLRKKHGMSQNDLAKAAKVALSTVNEIENDAARDVRLSTLASLAGPLKVEMHQLLFSVGFNLKAKDLAALEAVHGQIEQLYLRSRLK